MGRLLKYLVLLGFGKIISFSILQKIHRFLLKRLNFQSLTKVKCCTQTYSSSLNPMMKYLIDMSCLQMIIIYNHLRFIDKQIGKSIKRAFFVNRQTSKGRIRIGYAWNFLLINKS